MQCKPAPLNAGSVAINSGLTLFKRKPLQIVALPMQFIDFMKS